MERKSGMTRTKLKAAIQAAVDSGIQISAVEVTSDNTIRIVAIGADEPATPEPISALDAWIAANGQAA
jgi:hypothetical protein